LVFGIPDSPRWIFEYKKDRAQAISILKQINTDTQVEEEIAAMEVETAQEVKNESIFMKKYRKPLLFAFSLHFSISYLELMPFCIMHHVFLNWQV